MICTGSRGANSARELTFAPPSLARTPAADPSTPRETRRPNASTSPNTTNSSRPCRIKCSSRRVRNDRPRPNTYTASNRLVLPEAFAPLTSVNRESRSRAADCKQRKSVTCIRHSDNSQPHRHHDIASRAIPGRANQAAAVAVRQAKFDFLSIDGGQGVQQIIHIEPHFEIVAVVTHFDFLLRLLLLRVMCLYRHHILFHGDADATVFFIGENGGALQGLPQNIPIRANDIGRRRRDYPRIFRKPAVNELRSEANLADLRPNVIRTYR